MYFLGKRNKNAIVSEVQVGFRGGVSFSVGIASKLTFSHKHRHKNYLN